MKEIIIQCALNGLSFGNVSYNILREIYEIGIPVSLFPKNQNIDLSAYDSISQEFTDWLQESINRRNTSIKRETPELNIWHFNGSESRISNNSILYTFHESSIPTEAELNLANLYNKVIFSSNYSHEIFKSKGLNNSISIPIGFDKDFFETDKYKLPNKIHFGIMGKWESRKHTKKIIKLWSKKFGNDSRYILTCLTDNPFLNEEELNSLKSSALNGEEYHNINFLNRIDTNSQVNQYLNSIDIDLGGLSGAEGWNLPSFNATCLGKWSIVLNHTAHKDWANKENSILVEPSGQSSISDSKFFFEGSEFNQGQKFSFTEHQFNEATELAISKCKSKNTEGQKLKEKFSYKNTTNKILDELLDIS